MNRVAWQTPTFCHFLFIFIVISSCDLLPSATTLVKLWYSGSKVMGRCKWSQKKVPGAKLDQKKSRAHFHIHEYVEMLTLHQFLLTVK